MKPYEKTKQDQEREDSDLKNNAIMRWLQNQNAFSFNIGDIIIKKVKRYGYDPQTHQHTSTWETEVLSQTTGAPKKYIYAFENKLGIGYIRQLKANGDGFCGTLICVANFDPDNTKFELDPDFIDHQLIGDGEFEYNQEWANKRKYREEAMAKNRNIAIRTSSKKALKEWFLSLKVGDTYWAGQTFDELVQCQYKVLAVIKHSTKPPPKNGFYTHPSKKDIADAKILGANEWQTIEVEVLKSHWEKPGSKRNLTIGEFSWKKVTMSQPFPMKDPLCDQAK